MKVTRKGFLKVVGLGSAVVATVPFLLHMRAALTSARTVRIAAVPGEHYSPSFLRFCKRAKFRSVAEAVSHVKDRSVKFSLRVT